MDSNWGGRAVDYDLIDRLEQERHRKEMLYICPMWDWLKDFRDQFTAQGWWVTTRLAEIERCRLDPARGLVISGELWLTADEAHGEIG